MPSMCDFARTLETELATALRERDEARAELATIRPILDDLRWHANAICAITGRAENDITKVVSDIIADRDSLARQLAEVEDTLDSVKTVIEKLFGVGSELLSGLANSIDCICKDFTFRGAQLITERAVSDGLAGALNEDAMWAFDNNAPTSLCAEYASGGSLTAGPNNCRNFFKSRNAALAAHAKLREKPLDESVKLS